MRIQETDPRCSFARPPQVGWLLVFATIQLLAGAAGGARDLSPVQPEGSKGGAAMALSNPLGFGEWRRWEVGAGRGEEPSALARSKQGDVAVGDGRGVSWRLAGVRPDAFGSDSGERMRALLPAVRDLAFDGKGELWIGTEAGLYRWHRSGRPVRRSLRGAEGNPEIHDLATSGDVVLVASAAGAYWSSSGKIFQPLEFVGVGAAVSRVALFGVSGVSESIGPGMSAQVWLFGGNRLLRIGGRVTPVGLRVLDRTPISLPRPTSELEVVDLVFNPVGRRLALAYPDLIAIRSLAPDSEKDPVGFSWEIVRPVLAPGARLRSLVWPPDGLALSTDHGLFVAATPKGPYRRSAEPVGTRDCMEVVARPDHASLDSLMVLCRGGLYAFERRPRVALRAVEMSPVEVSRERASVQVSSLAPDPPVEEIRLRAFLRAGLDAGRSAALWSGLRRRAFWPELELSFGAKFDDDEARDRDQSFVSGDTRHLFDHSRDRERSFDVAIALDWDLGGIAYPLESVDLSRELRQIVSLRDDVADEINQLYFERQQLRAAIARTETLEPGEVARMRWRAQEIDAGLDAWTGGWIARWRKDHEPRSSSTRRVEP
ncbi:MAG: hypothetical protein GY910_20050 [bacterium]|nr:hypothetical protein [bacterium]